MESLYNRSMRAIRDGASTGALEDLGDLPASVRQALFDAIKWPTVTEKDQQPECHPAPCLRRSRFYQGFQRLDLSRPNHCGQYRQLLSTLVSAFEQSDDNPGETVVSLTLQVCVTDRPFYNPNTRRSDRKTVSSNLNDVRRLIAACPNLRRLDLKLDRDCDCGGDPESGDLDRFGYVLDAVFDALRVENDGRTALDELILRRVSVEDFGRCFWALSSLRFLSLDSCALSNRCWLRLLLSCSGSLSGLTLNATTIGDRPLDMPLDHVDLAALDYLAVDRTPWYTDDDDNDYNRSLISFATLQRVRRGRVCLRDDSDRRVLELISRNLSPMAEASYTLSFASDFDKLLFAQEVFGDRLVELRINNVSQFPDDDRIDEVIGRLVTISVLSMNDLGWRGDQEGGDRFLGRFLSDVGRCAKLRRLQICWDLTEPTLKLIFKHCRNLEFLFLAPRSATPDDAPCITDDSLKIWAASGAKPSEVYLGIGAKFTPAGISHLLRNSGNDLKASFIDDSRRLVQQNASAIERIKQLLRF